MPSVLRSHLALFLVNLLYGASYVVSKGLMPGVIGANGFILCRVVGAALLFWLLFLLSYEKVKLKDLGRLALCGLFGVGINQLFFFNGLMLTSPINAPVIMVTTPILVLMVSLIFLKEKIRTLQVVGVILGAVGAVIFSLQNSSGGFATSLGDLFIFFNAVSYAIYLMLVKPLMGRYNALTVITWVFTFGFVFVISWPYSILEFTAVNWSELSSPVIIRMIFVVVGVTFLPYLLNVYAMKKVSPTISAVYIYFQPLLATMFVYLFYVFGLEDYRGDINLPKILSAIIIFVGVYLVIKPAKENSSNT